MLYLFILLFTIRTQSTKKLYIMENRFFVILGIQNPNENEFHVFGNLAIWLWTALNKFLRFFKGVFTDPGACALYGTLAFPRSRFIFFNRLSISMPLSYTGILVQDLGPMQLNFLLL